MLKLEKFAKNLELTLTWRPPLAHAKGGFLYALLLALAFHLLAGLLFQIGPFKVLSYPLPLNSIVVESDLSHGQRDNTANQEEILAQINIKVIKDVIKEPPGQLMTLPTTTWIGHKQQKEQNRINKWLDLEEQTPYPLDFFAQLQKVPSTSTLAISITGELADRFLNQQEVQETKIDDLLNANFQALYAIQVEDRTGKVFWYEKKQVEFNPHANKLAEKLLKSLSFQIKEQGFISKGEVEILLSKGSNYD